MADKKMVTIDGATAAAYVAHAVNEVIAIYPITPSTPIAEVCDEWSAQGRTNIWGNIPIVSELQSEGGAAGAVHGALSTGALTTTFTASQGLLLMIPNMYKIAGEMTPTVFHVPARALAVNGLSIFGDHSDVMACRQTGWAMLASSNVQEVMDLALVAHAATLKARVPFMHFFDGFRTSHEVQKIEEIPQAVMNDLIDYDYVAAHRARAMDPEHPTMRGSAQNPDVYFTARESINKEYADTPAIVQSYMDRLAKHTGRQYHLFDYYGAKDAEHVIIAMGSGVEPVEEAIDLLNAQGGKCGLIKVRLFRPFSAEHFIKALPATVKAIAVLDRTKEPGSLGEPLYEDIRTAIGEMMESGNAPFKGWPKVVGGRYALGSAEFTPAMAKAVFDNLKSEKPKNKFTIGITDDLTGTSLEYDPSFRFKVEGLNQAMFYGLGSDGTVGANKNSIKIIADHTDKYGQGYFSYDSKKAGTVTVSHLRFGDKPIRSPYLIDSADFVACHKFSFLERVDMLSNIQEGGTFLLASPFAADAVWRMIPTNVQQTIIDKKLKFYVIDAVKIARENGMGARINVIMQVAFFKISGVLHVDQAIGYIKEAIKKTYGRKGEAMVEQNIKTVDAAFENIFEVNYPKTIEGNLQMAKAVPDDAPQFVREVLAEIINGRGQHLKTSQLPMDGVYPTATTKYEKRNLAETIPEWLPETCIACGQCSMVCPHAVIRMKAFQDKSVFENAPEGFRRKTMAAGPLKEKEFTIQISPEDCTGCGACINICPAKGKALAFVDQRTVRDEGIKNWDFFLNELPESNVPVSTDTPLGTQIRRPMFEFSGACAGCGETPYIKLITQLWGTNLVVANATGCSSIYSGNLPTNPYAQTDDGKGPTWGNSLFEDAAEYGFGMLLTYENLNKHALDILPQVGLDASLVESIKGNDQSTDEKLAQMRADVAKLKEACTKIGSDQAKHLLSLADYLVKKVHWVVGGDGWAYDIGYGGLDHVLASGKNINMLVMDTEVYSNTGGQSSKATPTGAIAKFAAGGKAVTKKPLGLMQSMYGNVYVAQINMGANMSQTIKAIKEAVAYDGPSLIIAYSHCISQGGNMMQGMNQGKEATTSGMWPLYRYDPRKVADGKNPFMLDNQAPSTPVEDYLYKQVRFKSLQKVNPERATELLTKIKTDLDRQFKELKYLADRPF
ncbi:pyruvate:ferredoxin (flavodoxin) oxidoreductase [Entomospira culicis]|uniref:Pyruvate:ferredoxin (Flavodoxin) oxidoreductase n=1 Tax=Entomospira culicis TaxID=2719989 RepID=A0A968L044_9SPIO|nr:pyruvate:ferredoxin (flavodoxin) oxidoreductase [Entomospira culicis]NIZ19737.1 pyruvate:ferredoxin (flavodoxin) oxidoreductase [Entomospira culicis]NIZ69951.1 pyruvate:ferredoxin (flavodoxin) oxidoreductase [Entomospira culicis]WDI37056.1 pyruvate:ferredoxin (flavodoxin) oxidoreductase [Entomospira culicis]WDI38685.1 pyruvate:ferredoxin (flavodoxin) oxidoreductase [Entomospira culicis]